MSLLKDKWVWISAAIGAILAIVLSMVFVAAYAAPQPIKASVSFAEEPGDYGRPTTVHWVFSGREGQYPRLNVLFTCWVPGTGDPTKINGQGYPTGADIVYADFHFFNNPAIYPGEGNVTTWPGNKDIGWSRWDDMPGDKDCAAALNDWQTQKLSSKQPRLHAAVYWTANDPRVP